jgi:hypothetical protein
MTLGAAVRELPRARRRGRMRFMGWSGGLNEEIRDGFRGKGGMGFEFGVISGTSVSLVSAGWSGVAMGKGILPPAAD